MTVVYVGSKYVPLSFISCSVASDRYVPCSMLRTPALTAAIAPSSPCACASTGTFFVAASCTIARISSSV